MKTVKHYALNTRTLARQFTNHLKAIGCNTTQPKAKASYRKGTLTRSNVNSLQSVTTPKQWLVSSCTAFKKPTPKKVFNVVNNKVVTG